MDHYDRAIKVLKAGKRLLLGSHYSPDGDAIGSILALGYVLQKMGKEVVLFNRDPVPFNLTFLQGSESIVQKLPPNDSFDTAIIVDCSEAGRVGGDFERAHRGAHVVCIDHHVGQISDALAVIIEPNAAATGELIAKLIKRMRIPLDATLAEYLYCTLVVDTGFFRYSNTHEETLHLAAELVRAGASPWKIAHELEENYPAPRFHLLGRALATLEIDKALRYASMEVTQKALAESGAAIDLSDEFASYPRSIAGVDIGALFREVDQKRTKVSLRSKEGFDVALIARAFGGGGHIHAAGCTIDADLQTAKQRVKEAIRKVHGNGNKK